MMTLAFLPGGMPGIGEIGIFVLVLVLLFGARKLPELARALGSSLTEFKRGQREGARIDAASKPRINQSAPQSAPLRQAGAHKPEENHAESRPTQG